MSYILPQIFSAGFFDMSIRYPNQSSTLSRISQSFELELPINYTANLYFNGQQYSVAPDELICVKPGMRRHSVSPYCCYYIHLSSDESDLYEIISNFPLITKITNKEEFHDVYSKIISEYNTNLNSKHTIKIYREVLKLINMLCVCNEKLKYPATVKKTAVHSATEYIKDNFIYDITLKDIANAAHLSPMYLRELFVKEMKMSPHEYIIKKRIGKAKELLALNVQTISEVATLSGFSSQSYFDYIFKKRTGMTPKQFKAKNNELYFK